jgi:hypothetical protein
VNGSMAIKEATGLTLTGRERTRERPTGLTLLGQGLGRFGRSLWAPEWHNPIARQVVGRQIVILADGEPWRTNAIEQRLNELLELDAKWDGLSATAVTERAVVVAIGVLFGTLSDATVPQIFALPDGGLQLEWHVGGRSVEIEIDGNGDPFVDAEPSEGEFVHGQLDNLLPRVREILREFAARLRTE